MKDFSRDQEFSLPRNPLELKDAHLKALKPKASQYDRLIGEGLILRVRPTGKVIFRYRYTLDGRKRVATVGDWPRHSLKNLRATYLKWADAVERGEDVAAARHKKKVARRTERAEKREKKQTALTIRTLADLFMVHTETGTNRRGRPYAPKTRAEYRHHLLKYVIPEFGTVPAEEIERKQVAAWLKQIAKKHPAQANHLLSTLSAAFSWAAGEELIDANIVAGMKKPGTVKSKERALDYDPELQKVVDRGEIRTFWNGLEDVNPLHRIALRLVLLTALRPGEVLGARWEHIFDNEWIIPKSATKNKTSAHKIPLTPDIKKMLKELRGFTGENPYLFPESRFDRGSFVILKNQPTKPATISRLLKGRFGFDAFTPHDLRRTAATHIKSLGYLDAEIGMLLHHTTGDVTAIYARGDDMKRKQKMLNAWHRKLKSVLTGETADNVISMRGA